MDVLLIEGRRDGYSIEQVGKTITVGELISLLEIYDESTPIYLCNDGGYTYGCITEMTIRESFENFEEN